MRKYIFSVGLALLALQAQASNFCDELYNAPLGSVVNVKYNELQTLAQASTLQSPSGYRYKVRMDAIEARAMMALADALKAPGQNNSDYSLGIMSTGLVIQRFQHVEQNVQIKNGKKKRDDNRVMHKASESANIRFVLDKNDQPNAQNNGNRFGELMLKFQQNGAYYLALTRSHSTNNANGVPGDINNNNNLGIPPLFGPALGGPIKVPALAKRAKAPAKVVPAKKAPAKAKAPAKKAAAKAAPAKAAPAKVAPAKVAPAKKAAAKAAPAKVKAPGKKG